MATMKRLASWLTEPPPYTVGGVMVNRAGLQAARTGYEGVRHAALSLRRRPVRAELSEHLRTLERDGVVAIPEFFDAADFERVEDAVAAWVGSDFVRDYPPDESNPHCDHAALTRYAGVITAKDTSDHEFANTLFRLIGHDQRIRDSAAYVMRHPISEPTQLAYEQLSLRSGHADDTDNLLVLHADRHFPTVKMFLYLNRNGREEGAFEYCRGSHRLTLNRIRFEREYGVHCAHLRHGELDKVPADAKQNGRIGVSKANAERLGLVPEPIVGDANTLVIANNRGFHRRGQMTEGHVRRQIRLVFHNLREPVLARVAIAAHKRISGSGD